jgi:hypothetical protein
MSEIIDINVTKEVEQIDINVTENAIKVNINSVSGGGASWGEIDGTLNNQTDLQNALNLKANESDLGSVAFSNDYEDLDNKPTIPSVTNLVPYTGATQDVDLNDKVLNVQLVQKNTISYEQYLRLLNGETVLLTTDLENNITNSLTVLPDKTISRKLIETPAIQFDTTAVETSEVGKLKWNDTDGTLDLGLKGGNVTLQLGQEQLVRVVNKVGANLLESQYKAVRITGAQGQRLKVGLAQATNDLLSAETIGLVTENIDNNQEGFITTSGLIRNINTTGSLQGETWTDGDVLYLSPTTAGNVTNVKPTAPSHLVIIGYVVHAHANNGSIFVKVDNGYELEELHNVTSTNYTTPIDTDSLLTFDVTNSLWKRLSWSNIKANLKTYFDTLYYSKSQSNKGVYTGTITWTGTTAPSGATSHTYNWTKIGNLVTLNVTLFYQNTGTALTSVVMDFMNNFPTPVKPNGLKSALNILYPALGKMTISETVGTTSGFDAYIRSNSANNGFQIVMNQASSNPKVVRLTTQYFTA